MEQLIKLDENHLIALLRKKSNIGFAYLYETYSGALLGAINGIVNNIDISGDILQEVFINIFRKIDSYNGIKCRLYTWMLTIARNLSIDYLRSKDNRNTRRNDDLGLYSSITAADTTVRTDHIGLRGICMKLAPKQWEVIELNYFKGYTHEEIAVIHDLPLGTVKARIRAGLLQLKIFI